MSDGPGLTVGKERAAGFIRLQRPAQRNAINDSMREAVAGALSGWIRDPEIYAVLIESRVPEIFSAGGDLRQLTEFAANDATTLRASLAAEYRLNWSLECFAKPTVSLIDGLVVGSGVGLTLYGTHRVAGERYVFSMPETAIGLFPDVGVISALARMPRRIGVYLALTGRRVDRADAFRLRLVTHCIPRGTFAAIVAGLADADPVDIMLDAFHVDPGAGALMPFEGALEDAFSEPTVPAILARLDGIARRTGPTAEWAGEVRRELLTRSPTALIATFEHLRKVGDETLAETLQRDYRLACRMIMAHDFREGVRAMVIDKDRTPHWQPSTAEAVTTDMIEALFAPLEEGELELPTRAQMQNLRSDR